MSRSDAGSVLAPKTPTDGQLVLHLDMDCFFAACERLRRPELRGEPVVIGGGFDADPPRGAVATASYEAREYGVHSAQPMAQALRRLPRRETTDDPDIPTGIYVSGDHEFYSEISQQVMAIVDEYAGTLRRIGIDEAYLDVTNETTWDDVEAYARQLKTEIQEDVGVTASIGCAPTLSCAKIASDHGKPDGLCVVEEGAVESFLAPLDIGEIHGIGPVAADRFKEEGIETAGDLAALSTQEVIDRFGSRATTLFDRVRGIDPRAVEPVGKPKSISKERSIEPSNSPEVHEAVIRTLAEQVTQRARRKDARYRTVGIKVVETPFDRQTREHSLTGAIRDGDLVEEIALELLEEFAGAEVRKLGVRVSNLEFFAGEQSRVSDWAAEGTVESESFDRVSYGQRRLSEYR